MSFLMPIKMAWWRLTSLRFFVWLHGKWFHYGGGKLRFYIKLAQDRFEDVRRLDRLWSGSEKAAIQLQGEVLELKKEIEYLREQLMNVRVCQSEDHRNIGWEVCAYIPQNVIDHLIAHPDQVPTFETLVSSRLVHVAVKGLIHVNKRGRINALVFAPVDLKKPAAPKWVAAVFESPEGNLSMSERLPHIPDKSKLRLVDPKEGQLQLPPM